MAYRTDNKGDNLIDVAIKKNRPQIFQFLIEKDPGLIRSMVIDEVKREKLGKFMKAITNIQGSVRTGTSSTLANLLDWHPYLTK